MHKVFIFIYIFEYLSGMPKAEQLDLSPTISFFLDLKNPGKSAGISLIPDIAKTWDIDELRVAKETSKTFNQLWRLSKGELQ